MSLSAPTPAFARDLHALVEKHIPGGLTPTPTQKACELLASAIELLPGSKQA